MHFKNSNIICPRQYVLPDSAALGVVQKNGNVSSGQAVVMEMALVFVFSFVIQAVCDNRRTDNKSTGGLMIGLTLASLIMAGVWFISKQTLFI